jgi:hypothetical protein
MAPKDHISLGCDFDELKPVFSSLLLESLLHPQVIEGFLAERRRFRHRLGRW